MDQVKIGADAGIPEPEERDPLDSVPTLELVPYYRNPRIGDVTLIEESLKAHGQYKPLVVNRGSITGRANEVLAGNHLLQAGKRLNLPTMWAFYVDVDEKEAAKIVLIDNRSSDRGKYDEPLLGEVLDDLADDLLGTGFSADDLAALLEGPKAKKVSFDVATKTTWPVTIDASSADEAERLAAELVERGYSSARAGK